MWKATIFLKFLALSAVVLLNDNNGIDAAYAHGYLNNAVAGGVGVGGGIRGGVGGGGGVGGVGGAGGVGGGIRGGGGGGDFGNGGNGGFNNVGGGFANSNGGYPNGNGGFANSNGGYPNGNGGIASSSGGFSHGNGGIVSSSGGFAHGNGGIVSSSGGSQGARIGGPGGTYGTGFDFVESTEFSPVRSGFVTVEASATNPKLAINLPKINYGDFEYKPTRQGYIISYELLDGSRHNEVGIIPGAENVPIYMMDEKTKEEREKVKKKNRKLSPGSLKSAAG